TNIGTAAVWLPLTLAFGELALRHAGRARYAFTLLAGVAFGLQGLIIHVQVGLMSASAFAAFCLFRTITGPVGGRPTADRTGETTDEGQRHGLERLVTPLRSALVSSLSFFHRAGRRIGLAIGIVAIAGFTGGALAAVQLLPLYELSTFSFRGDGVDYAYATQYSLPPVQLLSLLFPDFFVANGVYWGLWSHWEVFAYVGIAPLLLALIGVLLARHRLVVLFLALGACSLVVALGEYSPWGIHRSLAGLPGFSVLRAPGRFVFLFTLSVAVLAAFGSDALRREFDAGAVGRSDDRTAGTIVRRTALSVVLLLCQLAAMIAPLALSLAAVFVETHKAETVGWLQATFARMRGFDARWTAEHLYQFVLAALDVTQPATLRQLALLLASAAVLLLWDRLRVLGRVWQLLIVAIIAFDLIGVGRGFHPTMPYSTLAAPSGLATFLEGKPGLYRVFTQKGLRDEPNRLLAFPVAEANGYSSLEPDRHQQFAARAMYAPNRLLDLLNVRYYAVKNAFVAAQSFNLTSYDPRRPLLSSTGRNPAGFGSFRLDDVPADTIQVISALRGAASVPQGMPVARLTATDATGARHDFELQAGVHTAEWAWERPDLRGKVPHQLPQVARTWQHQDGNAPPFPAHYYFAEFPLGASVKLRRVEVQFLHPTAQVEIFGISTSDADENVEQLERAELEKFTRAYVDEDVIVYENQGYLPRAFLVPSAVIERPGGETLDRLAQGDFSPERMVVLEQRFDRLPELAPPSPPGQGTPIRFNRPAGTEISSGPGTVHLLRFDDDRVRLEATARQNAMLFLADLAYPGWKAYLDGVETPIYRANYLFRAVYVPAGRHTVEFVYRPLSFRLGLLITLVALLATVGALVGLTVGSRLRPRSLFSAARGRAGHGG
ncbi:MAG: YfhO family protein, partial [Chloroflexota bacterium]